MISIMNLFNVFDVEPARQRRIAEQSLAAAGIIGADRPHQGIFPG
jgi:hypothetical protein